MCVRACLCGSLCKGGAGACRGCRIPGAGVTGCCELPGTELRPSSRALHVLMHWGSPAAHLHLQRDLHVIISTEFGFLPLTLVLCCKIPTPPFFKALRQRTHHWVSNWLPVPSGGHVGHLAFASCRRCMSLWTWALSLPTYWVTSKILPCLWSWHVLFLVTFAWDIRRLP